MEWSHRTLINFVFMKKIAYLFILLFSIASWSQNYSEKYPKFENCSTVEGKEGEACFINTIQDVFKTNFNKELTKEKSSVIALFAVDTLGNFNVLYLDAKNDEIKKETTRIFSLLPKVQPATFNNKPVFAKYTLRLNFPFLDEAQKAKVEEDKFRTQKVEAKNELTEYEEDSNYKEFKNPQYTSGLNIPLNFLLYDQFEGFVNQVGTNNHTSVKPYSYQEVSKYYDFQKNYESLSKNKSSWWGRKIWNENLLAIQGDGYWFVFNPIFDFRGGKDFSSELQNTFVNTRGINLFGALGKHVTFTTSIYESQGRFADYYNAYAESIKPSGGNPAVIPGVGIAKRFRTDAYDMPLAEASIKFTATRFFDATLGYGRNFIGDGYRSILQGDATSPYPFIKFNTTFWKIKYTNTYMFLRDVTPANTAEDTYASKYMANHYLSWNATKRLNIGLFESVVWSNSNGRGFDANFINPIIFYRAVEFASSPKSGNALLGLTAKYKINSQINTYGQFLIDEFSIGDVSSSNKSWKNKFGYQIGAKYFNAFNVANLNLQVECNIVRPYVYSHSNTLTNYAHNNQSMGHPWGSNLREVIGIARYRTGRYYAEAKVIYGKRGFDLIDDTNYVNTGSNIFLSYEDENHPRLADEGVVVGQGNTTNVIISDLKVGYIVNPSSNMRIYGNLIYRNFDPMVNTISTFKSNTTWFSVGLTTDLFNWYFDY